MLPEKLIQYFTYQSSNYFAEHNQNTQVTMKLKKILQQMMWLPLLGGGGLKLLFILITKLYKLAIQSRLNYKIKTINYTVHTS